MKQKVGVIDYGVSGNMLSITRAIENAGALSRIISRPEDLLAIDKLVIPGVGSYVDGMEKLHESSLVEPLIEFCYSKNKPILGICLGMQILSKVGFEYGETKGLALIDAEVKKVTCKGVVPHMGFNTINPIKNSYLLKGISADDLFYFMHSYELCNYTDVLTLTNYADHTFVSAVEKDNVIGVQFHPENSRAAGLTVFRNFINI